MQTKKTFIATAARIKAQLSAVTSPDAIAALETLAYEFADGYGRENPRFDRSRFLTACGLVTAKHVAGAANHFKVQL